MSAVPEETTALASLTSTTTTTINIDDNGVHHSDGRSVRFERDEQNRITTVTDPRGNTLSFEYDRDDLVAVTDREGNTTSFVYDDNHLLEAINDPTGQVPARQEYDDDGRLVAIVTAEGRRTELRHDPANRVETVVDRVGGITVFEYDADGNITSVANALGEPCDNIMDAICDPENADDVALVCYNDTWQKAADIAELKFGCFCQPAVEDCAYAHAVCAVPGFVGLDRKGRPRKVARRLRMV